MVVSWVYMHRKDTKSLFPNKAMCQYFFTSNDKNIQSGEL